MAAADRACSQAFFRRRSAIALGITIACSGQAFAQAQSSGAADTSEPRITEIIVTGSRISTAGFDAPTPTTVLSEDDLRQAGRTDISATLTDLPQFRNTQSATSTNTVTSSGQSPADLRGLGSSRTLVLVNNRRYVSSNDLQTVPYSMVKRIDVVTGGASAAYGSDAVAGVVNIILDEDKEGAEIGVQHGISTHGDGEKNLVEASFGTRFADGRGHFMIGGDFLKDEGVIPGIRRPQIGAAAFLGGIGPVGNLRESARSAAGVINTGVFAGQTFNSDGTLRPFEYGPLLPGTPYMFGGEGYHADQFRSVSAPIERRNAMARASFEITETAKVWAEVNYNWVGNERVYFADLAINQLEFSYDNPFLNLTPEQRALAQASGESTFVMGRALTDVSLARYKYDREVLQTSIGLDGTLGDDWRYNIFFGHGKQKQDMNLLGITLTTPFANAIDAVVGPGGTPVCRVALTDPTTACRPLNLFGSGRADPAAVDYATADWRALQENWLDAGGIILSGEPFELFNQPVSFATGVEYRREKTATGYDQNSLAGNFNTINGVNIGKIGHNVKEAFVEVAVPLLADVPFVKSLNFNGAARNSDYSTSGSIWSWKLGGTWEVVDDFKLRATRSRDIRAANLDELFSTPSTFFTTVADLGQAGSPTSQITLFTGGNPNLDPEIADTVTFGAVYSPSFLPGFEVSLDYYDIKIEDVIIDLSAQQIVNSCYDQGNQDACSQITRGGDGNISEINATYINLARFQNKGIDLETSYRTDLMSGQLTVRALANYVDTLTVDNGLGTIEGAGYLGSQVVFLVPKWRGTVTFTYESDRFGGDLRARYLDGGGYAPPEVIQAPNNHIASRTYVDLGLRTYLDVADDTRLTVFGNVQNLFDKEPALGAVNSPYLDIMGRYFTLGVRANF